MSAAVLAALGAAAPLVVVAWLHRPRATRRPPVSPSHCRPAGRVGAGTDRGAAAVAALAVLVLTIEPLAVPVLVIPALAIPARRARRRLEADVLVVRCLPATIDLLRLALSATGSLRLAVRSIAPVCAGPAGPALVEVVDRLDRGEPLVDAIEGSFSALGDPARPLVRVIAAAERYGAPLDPGLERVGDQARRRRRRDAEAAARRVPVRLLSPLVLCMLPAFVILTVIPILARTVSSIGGG